MIYRLIKKLTFFKQVFWLNARFLAMEILNKKLKLFLKGLNKNIKTPSEKNHKCFFAMNMKYIMYSRVHSLNGSKSITCLDNIGSHFII